MWLAVAPVPVVLSPKLQAKDAMVALPSGSVEVEAKFAVRSVTVVVKLATGGAFTGGADGVQPVGVAWSDPLPTVMVTTQVDEENGSTVSLYLPRSSVLPAGMPSTVTAALAGALLISRSSAPPTWSRVFTVKVAGGPVTVTTTWAEPLEPPLSVTVRVAVKVPALA